MSLGAVTGFVGSTIKPMPVSGGPVTTAGSGESGMDLSTLGAKGGALLGTAAGTTQYDPDHTTYTDFGNMGLASPVTTTKGGAKAGTYWNTALDKQAGDIDTQIKQMGAYKGTTAFDQAKYDALVKQRQAINLQRWQSVHTDGSGGPGFKALQQALNRGDLSMADLGSIDISVLGDDAKLAQAVTDAVNAKKTAAVSPAPVAAPVDPTNNEQADANGAIDNSLSATQDYIKSQMGDLNTFDQGVQSTENQEASTGANLGRMAGAEAAGMAAGQAGANTAAQGAAQRDVLKQNQQTDLDKFLSDSLEKDIGDNSALASMDVAHRTQIQSQAADHLVDEISKSIGTADTQAQGQLQELQAAIAEWKAHMDDQAQSTSNWMKVIKIVGGLAMAGAGVATANPALGIMGGSTALQGAVS